MQRLPPPSPTPGTARDGSVGAPAAPAMGTFRGGVLVRANSTFAALFAAGGDATGSSLESFVEAPRDAAPLRAAFAEGRSHTGAMLVRSLDGATFLAEVHAETVSGSGASAVGVLVVRTLSAGDDPLEPPPPSSRPVLPMASSTGFSSAPPPAQALPAHTLDLARDLLRETSQLMAGVAAEAGAVRATFQAARASVPADVAAEVGRALQALTSCVGAASSMTRKLRHLGAGRVARVRTADVLEDVRATISPLVGARLTVSAGSAADIELEMPRDDLVLALAHLALRTFRASAGGSVRIGAYAAQAPAASSDGPPRAVMIIDLVGEAPGGPPESPRSAPASVASVASVPSIRAPELGRAFGAVQSVLADLGVTLDPEDVGPRSTRCVVRLPLPAGAR